MALVAKVYQEYEQVGAAYTKEDGKNYIDVVTEDGEIKAVRMYTIEQYNFLLGMQYQRDKIAEERRKVAESYNEERKINAGFKEGYIVAVLGDTYTHRKKLKDQGAKFSSQFKWYFEGGTEPICATRKLEELGLPVRYLRWEEVSHTIETGATVLKPTNELEKLVRVDVEISDSSEFRGNLGDEFKGIFHLYERKIIDGSKGRHALNFLKDSSDNVYLWNTSIKDMPEYGIYSLRGTIGGHKIYKGVRQTLLSEVEVV